MTVAQVKGKIEAEALISALKTSANDLEPNAEAMPGASLCILKRESMEEPMKVVKKIPFSFFLPDKSPPVGFNGEN